LAPARLQNVQAARISGVVIAEGGQEDGEPVTGVTVALTNGVQAQNTATDERGEFSFTGVAPGRHTISISKQGYLATELGAFRPGEAGTPIEVSGSSAADVVMAHLARPAAISGTVLNDDGTAAIDVMMVARPWTLAHPDLPFSTRIHTDMRGAFTVVGLAPGDYVLSGINGDPIRRARGVTYFPGVTAPARAERIQLHAGETKELPPMKQATADTRITGTVVSAGGTPVSGASITVQTIWDRVIATSTGADGRFEVTVPAGHYDVVASDRGFEVVPLPANWARTSVDAAAGKTAPVTMSLKPTAGFSGRVISETSDVPPGDLAIGLTSGGITKQSMRILNDRFEFDRVVPGDYGLTLEGPPQSPWWLKSATVNGRSLLAGPFELQPGMRVSNATLTVSRDRGELGGLVTGRNGLPQTEYWVAVIPLDASVRHPASPQVVRTRPATNGRFLFERLPAGEYALAVFGDLGPGEWRTPELLASLVAGGIKVTVPPETPVVQNIRIER